jgi:uncharacterized protein (TIGR04222 family)
MWSWVSLAATLLLVRSLIRILAPPRGRRSAAAPDYALVAHLVGGPKRVALAGAAGALAAGVLPFSRFAGRAAPPTKLSDVESAVAHAFRAGQWPAIPEPSEVRASAAAVAARADKLGLTGHLRPLPAHTLAILGVAAAAVPLGDVSWWALGGLIPLYLLLIRPTRRSLAGERLVRGIRTTRPDLNPLRQADWRTLTPADAGMTVALHGPAALRAMDAVFARRLLDPPARPRTHAGGPDGGCGDGGE